MEILQNLFMSALQANLTLEKLGTKLIDDKFQAVGIVLTEKQKRQIEKDLAAGGSSAH